MPPRRVTPAEYNRLVRQAQSQARQQEARRRQAINEYNRKASQHNARLEREATRRRQAINEYNRKASQHNARLERDVQKHNEALRKQAREVDAYNRKVEAHNARVRRDQQRLNSEIKRLERQASSSRYVTTQASTRTLHEAFGRVDVAAEAEPWSQTGVVLADLAEAETANSAAATNALLGDQGDDEPTEGTVITDELSTISDDLDKRWHGALFSLNSRNPDAARHFCTSSREILTTMIDLEAPDEAVLAAIPDCDKTDDGKPFRRAKIGFLLEQTGSSYESLGDFVDTDIDDVLQLFRTFNDGTHGDAGAFDLNALRALKRRVEGAIQFLSAVVRGAAA